MNERVVQLSLRDKCLGLRDVFRLPPMNWGPKFTPPLTGWVFNPENPVHPVRKKLDRIYRIRQDSLKEKEFLNYNKTKILFKNKIKE